jgi:hypothetical protein
MDPDALSRLSARIEALEAEKTALVRRVLRGEGDLRAADERAADASQRFREAQARAATEASQAAALLRERDALREELATQAMLLRELPVLAARCEALEAAAAEKTAEISVKTALTTERTLREGIEAAFAQEVLTRVELEKALAESHAARMAIEEALAHERKGRDRAEVALAATGELLQVAEERLAMARPPDSARPRDIDSRAFPRSSSSPANADRGTIDPPSSALPSTRDVRAREKGLRDELTLLGARNDALVELAHHALRALLAAVEGLDPSEPRRATTDHLVDRVRMLLGGVAPGQAEPRIAAAMVTSLGGTLRIDPAVGHVIIDFSCVRKSDAVAVEGDFGPDQEEAVADAYLLFVASWAASVCLASKTAQLPASPEDAARMFRFTPFGSLRR